VIDIQIQRDRTCEILGLSQYTYIDKVLDRYDMKNFSPGDTPIIRGDKLSLLQCPKNDLQKDQLKDISYALTVESLIYAQVYTPSDVAYDLRNLTDT